LARRAAVAAMPSSAGGDNHIWMGGLGSREERLPISHEGDHVEL